MQWQYERCVLLTYHVDLGGMKERSGDLVPEVASLLRCHLLFDGCQFLSSLA